jgi:hypothetical protein
MKKIKFSPGNGKSKTDRPPDAPRADKLKQIYEIGRNNFHDAELIFGIDEETGNRFVVFGAETLQGIIDGTEPERECTWCFVEILQRTEELEALLAAVQCARSYYDYADSTRSLADVRKARIEEFNALLAG